MTFTKESYLAQFYLKLVNEGMDREEVPALFNLREIVFAALDKQ